MAYKDGAPMRLSDIGEALDSVEDIRTAGLSNWRPAVLVIVFRQPGANIIKTVDNIYAMLPQLQASMPAALKLTAMMDRTTTILGSIQDVERSLLLSIALVILVVF